MSIDKKHLDDIMNRASVGESGDGSDFTESIMEGTKVLKISHNFSLIYHGISQKYNLSPTETILFGMIHSLSTQKGKGYCYVGVAYFADLINVSEQTIYTSLNNLKSKNLIRDGSKDERFGTVRRKPTQVALDEIETLKKLRGSASKY